MNLDTFFTMQAMSPGAQKAVSGKATTSPGHTQNLNFIDIFVLFYLFLYLFSFLYLFICFV